MIKVNFVYIQQTIQSPELLCIVHGMGTQL